MTEMEPVFEAVSQYFAVLSDPTRLRIMYALCQGEKSVSDIVHDTQGTQTNISRHLNLMYGKAVLARRRSGSQVLYSVADQALIEMCRNVCMRVSAGLTPSHPFSKGANELLAGLGNNKRPSRRVASART